MKVVIALDSFKGSLSSNEANKIIYNEFKRVFPNYKYELISLSDGGEGFVESITSNKVNVRVKNPLGKEINSYYGMLNENTAIIEMALASGIELIDNNSINANKTTSYGTGQLINHAIENGVKSIIIGLGGSATNDMGLGMLQALGAKFYNKKGKEINIIGKNIFKIDKIDTTNVKNKLNNIKVVIAADVNNPLIGINGASFIYGRQKGLTKQEQAVYDNEFKRLSDLIKEDSQTNFLNYPGAGAAGGIGYTLLSYTNSTIKSGFEVLSNLNNLKTKVLNANILITGEGKIDSQTKNGKAPYLIAKMNQELNPQTKNYAFCGLKGNVGNLLNYFQEIININENDPNKKEWIYNANKNLKESAYKLALKIKEEI